MLFDGARAEGRRLDVMEAHDGAAALRLLPTLPQLQLLVTKAKPPRSLVRA